MILIPLILVCSLLILIGFLAGKMRGESIGTMAKELFGIGRSTIGPIVMFVIIVLLIALILWFGYQFLNYGVDRLNDRF